MSYTEQTHSRETQSSKVNQLITKLSNPSSYLIINLSSAEDNYNSVNYFFWNWLVQQIGLNTDYNDEQLLAKLVSNERLDRRVRIEIDWNSPLNLNTGNPNFTLSVIDNRNYPTINYSPELPYGSSSMKFQPTTGNSGDLQPETFWKIFSSGLAKCNSRGKKTSAEFNTESSKHSFKLNEDQNYLVSLDWFQSLFTNINSSINLDRVLNLNEAGLLNIKVKGGDIIFSSPSNSNNQIIIQHNQKLIGITDNVIYYKIRHSLSSFEQVSYQEFIHNPNFFVDFLQWLNIINAFELSKYFDQIQSCMPEYPNVGVYLDNICYSIKITSNDSYFEITFEPISSSIISVEENKSAQIFRCSVCPSHLDTEILQILGNIYQGNNFELKKTLISDFINYYWNILRLKCNSADGKYNFQIKGDTKDRDVHIILQNEDSLKIIKENNSRTFPKFSPQCVKLLTVLADSDEFKSERIISNNELVEILELTRKTGYILVDVKYLAKYLNQLELNSLNLADLEEVYISINYTTGNLDSICIEFFVFENNNLNQVSSLERNNFIPYQHVLLAIHKRVKQKVDYQNLMNHHLEIRYQQSSFTESINYQENSKYRIAHNHIIDCLNRFVYSYPQNFEMLEGSISKIKNLIAQLDEFCESEFGNILFDKSEGNHILVEYLCSDEISMQSVQELITSDNLLNRIRIDLIAELSKYISYSESENHNSFKNPDYLIYWKIAESTAEFCEKNNLNHIKTSIKTIHDFIKPDGSNDASHIVAQNERLHQQIVTRLISLLTPVKTS